LGKEWTCGKHEQQYQKYFRQTEHLRE
jgi:hypothetical protein